MSVRSATALGSCSRSGTTVQTSSAIPSSVRTCAERTESRCSASTPAIVENRPVRSGAATVTVQVTASSGSARTSSRPLSTSRAWSGVSGGGGGAGRPSSRSPARRTSSSTSPAFHSLQAAGPVARASATVRAASSSSDAWSPTAATTVSVVAGSSRSRRVAVSTSSRCWATTSSRVSTSASAKPRRAATVRASRAPAALWSTPSDSEPLPMSCSSAPTSSRSGRDTSRTSGAARTAASSRCRSTLKRWTALRCGRCRTRSHSGQQPGQQPGLVERLPDRDQLRPGAEQVDEELAGVLRPGLGQRRGVGHQAVHRAGRQREPGAGGAGRHPQHEQRVGARVRLRREHGLAVVLGQPGAEQPQHRLAAADEPGALRPGRLQRPPPGHVGGVRHGRRGPADGAQQVVGVAEPQQPRHGVLLLLHEHVGRAAGDDLQRVAHVGEGAYGVVGRPVRPVGDPRGGHRPQAHQVAQPAAALLEVGLEVVAQVAVLGTALVPHLAQLGQPAPGRGTPVGEHAGAQPAHQRGLAGHRPGVQQAEQDRQVGAGQPPGLVEGADAVVQPHPAVPDRVPDLVGERGHARQVVAVGVQQQQVEVAAR